MSTENDEDLYKQYSFILLRRQLKLLSESL